MDTRLIFSKGLQALQEDGVLGVLRSALSYLRSNRSADDFDLHYGTDTTRNVPLWLCDIRSPNASLGRRYQVTPESDLIEAFQFLGEDPQAFTFVDLGCGKGRTLLIASQFGFKQIIGVEFARELADIAKDNLTKTQTSNAAVIHGDVVDFQFPNENTVVYLYNPFERDIMRKVLSNLRASNVKKLYVIYKLPECADDFDSSGFLERLGQPSSGSHITVWKGRGCPAEGALA
jgi:SAM-dependent methyltransferase